MELFNLNAVVDQRRAAREREARAERLRRPQPEPAAPVRAASPLEPRCHGTVEHAPRAAA